MHSVIFRFTVFKKVLGRIPLKGYVHNAIFWLNMFEKVMCAMLFLVDKV